MKIEHMAFQVADPQKVAAWYVEHLGFTIKRQGDTPPFMTFLADDSGTVMLEIYRNDDAPLPDYANQNPLVLHLALSVDDMQAEKQRLLDAGATIATDTQTTPAGDQLTMLRDPWGFAVQLVKRQQPMI
jgi:uncharacterized glyoxalase superfamily protein PhnB